MIFDSSASTPLLHPNQILRYTKLLPVNSIRGNAAVTMHADAQFGASPLKNHDMRGRILTSGLVRRFPGEVEHSAAPHARGRRVEFARDVRDWLHLGFIRR